MSTIGTLDKMYIKTECNDLLTANNPFFSTMEHSKSIKWLSSSPRRSRLVFSATPSLILRSDLLDKLLISSGPGLTPGSEPRPFSAERVRSPAHLIFWGGKLHASCIYMKHSNFNAPGSMSGLVVTFCNFINITFLLAVLINNLIRSYSVRSIIQISKGLYLNKANVI